MRLNFWLALFATVAILLGIDKAFGQVMPQQQNCTTTTSGSISHTHCGPPVVVQVTPPVVNVAPAAVTVNVQPPPPPKVEPKPAPKKVGD